MTEKARMERTDNGLVAADAGWFIENIADLRWETVPGGGTWCAYESPGASSPLLGIGVHILYPGDTPGYYHSESNQEGFLVLSGECIAVVEGVERRMGPWDYFHSPPETAHIMVGAGGQPCALLTVGTRSPGTTTHYVPDPAAAKHGASVAEPTDSAKEAYVGRPPFSPARSPWKELRPDR
jgi:mannose-6-phosphate isomerase-like protein (cupin superfamily)